MNLRQLFEVLYAAKTETDVEGIIQKEIDKLSSAGWKPIGGSDSNYSIIENQQSNPIGALVEKITNSIDALLMRKCLEQGLDPKSPTAPRTMDEAVAQFFPEHKHWDLLTARKKQSEEIQIVADGPTRESAVIIYDNGEGQSPERFEDTFLSLMKGNKNEIHFVQGKYNMGGSGAIVFCGKKGYQLIASKRFDNSGDFGFTLVREHPLGAAEQQSKKNTWYEYLVIDDRIPSFPIDQLNLGLHGRPFKTGTVIKMYSYQMKGIYGFAQELSQSLNEFLFRPMLPFLAVDKKERYPNNPVLEATVFGLQRRLEDETDYVEDWFSEEYKDALFGKMKVTCYVFRAKQEGKSLKDTKDDIKRRYFKNGMSVLFSMNGQVHGHYSSAFISQSLKFNMLKDYVLVNVDCTNMAYDFRKELFMASRDRLREGDEANALRDFLKKKLAKSKLDEINKRRKESIGFESEDTSELIKSFAKNLPKDNELFKLLENTLKLDDKKPDKVKEKGDDEKKPKQKEEVPFLPQRFPSFFRLYHNKNGQAIPVPVGGEKTLKFETDVEDHYFDRTEEPGDLQVSVLSVKRDEGSGGTKPGQRKEPGELMNITKASPNKGTIKISFAPGVELRQGDEVEVKASLKGPGDTWQDEIVWLKVVAPEAPKEKAPKTEEELNQIGLPELKRVTKEQWDALEQQGIEMNHDTVMYPQGAGEKLEAIYINLDSHVFLNSRKKLTKEEEILLAQKKFLASVYFHTLFLYMITKQRKYSLSVEKEGVEQAVTIDEYVRDVFDSYYSDFLLNFGMEQLMSAVSD